MTDSNIKKADLASYKSHLTVWQEKLTKLQAVENGDRNTFEGEDGNKGLSVYFVAFGQATAKVKEYQDIIDAINAAGSTVVDTPVAPITPKVMHTVTIQRAGKESSHLSVPEGTNIADILNDENVDLADRTVQTSSGRPGDGFTRINPVNATVEEPTVIMISQKIIGG